MKKRQIISLLVLLTIFIGCNNSNEFKNDLESLNLKGKVKTLRQTRYYADEKFGEATKGKSTGGSECFYKTFNKMGNLTESQEFNYSGDLVEKTVIKYNPLNKIEEEIVYDSDGEQKEKTTYHYDENENLSRKTNYNSDGSLIVKETYKYNSEGEKTEKQVINSEGVLDKKLTYRYNKKGELIEINNYNADGSLYNKNTYKYNDEGNIIECITYDKEGYLAEKSHYLYDTKNSRIESEAFKNDHPAKILYEFNSNFSFQHAVLLIKETGETLEDLWLTFELIKGLKEVKLKENEDELHSEYIYELDDHGNWIKRTYYFNEPSFITEREITYY